MESDCLTCRYRGTVPNSRHSSCKHPAAESVLSNSEDLLALMKSIANEGRIPYLYPGFKVEFDQAGVIQGYALWPFNFDPIWLEECTGYEEGI